MWNWTPFGRSDNKWGDRKACEFSLQSAFYTRVGVFCPVRSPQSAVFGLMPGGLCYVFCSLKSRPAKWNYTFPLLIYLAESSAGFGRREEGTQRAAKLQLSVRYKKSHTFHEDMSADVFHSPLKNFFWGRGGEGAIGVPRYPDIYTDLEVLCLTRLELRSVERNYLNDNTRFHDRGTN